MSQQGSGRMKWDPWQPQPYAMVEGAPVLSRGTVTNHYVGDLDATGNLETLVISNADGSNPFIGIERVTGRLGGRHGSFVLRLEGSAQAGSAQARLMIVPGSGTGELAGLSGEGSYVSNNVGPDGHADFSLVYVLE